MRLVINPYGGNLEIESPVLVTGDRIERVEEPADPMPFIRSRETRSRHRMQNYLDAKRTLMLSEITKLAVAKWGEEAGRAWMHSANPRLRGKSPLDLLDTPLGVTRVKRFIQEPQ